MLSPFLLATALFIKSTKAITCDNDNNCIINCDSTNCTYSSFISNRTNLITLTINCNVNNSCSNMYGLQSMLFETQLIKNLTINCNEQSSCKNMKLLTNIVNNANINCVNIKSCQNISINLTTTSVDTNININCKNTLISSSISHSACLNSAFSVYPTVPNTGNISIECGQYDCVQTMIYAENLYHGKMDCAAPSLVYMYNNQPKISCAYR